MQKKAKKTQQDLVGRRIWGMNPIQKVVPNKKAYNRKKQKPIQQED